MQKHNFPVNILYKSIAGRYRPVSYPDGPITARYRFMKNASWVCGMLQLKGNGHTSKENNCDKEINYSLLVEGSS